MNRLTTCLVLLSWGIVTMVSCKTKETPDEDARGLQVSFEAVAPSSIGWQSGDKISMLAFKEPTGKGALSSNNVVNFSSNRFSAGESGSTSVFTGRVPSLDVLPQGNYPVFCVYPACNLTVSTQSSSFTLGGKEVFGYTLSGPTIPERQDGTGWRYCCFVSLDGTVSAPGRVFNHRLSFKAVNALVKFHYFSGKAIKKIVITLDGQSVPALAGPFKLTTAGAVLTEGCTGRSITIVNENTLPEEILFACGGISKGQVFSISFTSADDKEVSRSMVVETIPVQGQVFDMGNIDLSEWTSSELASQTAINMGMGVNVGGLESVNATTEAIPERADGSGMHVLDRMRPETYETNGANNRITQTTMNALKAAGFGSVRIPITWFNHMGAPVSESGVIDKVWLDHIQHVVDLVLDAGMYAVINIHHDAGTYDFCWLKADWSNYAATSAQLKSIWTQIANHFKNYDYHLLFEGYNEICDENKSWWAPSSENGFKAANALNQDFVNAVRATGGNNSVRNLIVSTYTSSEHEEGLKGFILPEDLAPGHLLVQIHSYRPNEFITARTVGDRSRLEFYESDKAEIDEMFDRVQTYILDRGWPCVMGEYGAFAKQNQAGNRNELGRAEHAYYYTTRALQRGIVPMYWYNPMCYRDRDKGSWTYPVLAQGLIDAWKDYSNNAVVYKKYDHDAAYPIGNNN